MYERLKQLRELLGYNQTEFSNLLGLGRSTLGMMEVDKREILERHIKTICSIFNVNEEWFRDGQGDMFVETKESFLSELSVQYDLDNLDMSLLESYISLTAKDRGVIKKYVHSVFETLNDEIATTVDEVLEESKSIVEDEESYIERELDAYRLELEAEKKGKILSASEDIRGNVN